MTISKLVPRSSVMAGGAMRARVAVAIAKMHAQNEALRREAWRHNAPVRAAAAEIAAVLDDRP